MNRTPFTVDDLTVSEHGILSRKVKGNPGAMLVDASTQNAGEVLAGLAWLRDRRTDQGAKLEDYLARTLNDLQVDLGLTGDTADEQTRHTLAALDWLDELRSSMAEDAVPLLEAGPGAPEHQRDPSRVSTDTDIGRALVYAVTGVDVGLPVDDDDQPSPATRSQEAIDTVTDSNGADPTVPPASPSSGP